MFAYCLPVGGGNPFEEKLLLGGVQRGRLLASFFFETLCMDGIKAQAKDEHPAGKGDDRHRCHCYSSFSMLLEIIPAMNRHVTAIAMLTIVNFALTFEVPN
jgi:hypothetical protein